MNDLILCCTCNNTKYKQYLTTLLESIKVNACNIIVHIRLVNCDASFGKELASRYNIIIQDDVYNNKNKRMVNHVGVHKDRGIKYLLTKHRKEVWGVYDDEAYYCCMVKYDTISNLIKKYKCVMYIDVDTIVRKPIHSITEIMTGFDIGLYFDKKVVNFPHAGLIVVNNTERSIECIESMRDFFTKIFKTGDMKIGDGDGDKLYNECIKHKLKIKMLEDTWKDEGLHFSNESIMWSGRSERKLENKIYLKEVEKYTNE